MTDIDYRELMTYSGGTHPDDPKVPKIGTVEERDGIKWCWLSKVDETCTVNKWFRLYTRWTGDTVALNDEGTDIEYNVKVPPGITA